MIELSSITTGSGALMLSAIAFVVAGCIGAAFGTYLLLLAVAAHFYPERRPHAPPTTRLVILIPAHNESRLVARCIRSLLRQTYPRKLYEIVVVADNCDDDTAAAAAAAGADEVLVRNEPAKRGKGQALRWTLDQLWSRASVPDAVVVIDADSVADSAFLAILVEPFTRGTRVVQGESLLEDTGPAGASLRVTAFLLINRVRSAGRAALGLPGRLAGNGMLIARDVLEARPWDAFTSAEDVEYSLNLRTAGIKIGFARGAVLLSPPAPNQQAALHQELRWQGGKTYLARKWVGRLAKQGIRDRAPSLLVEAFDFALPPLSLLAAADLLGAAIASALAAASLMSPLILAPWLLALGTLALFVIVGLHAAQAPRSAYAALARAPAYILRMVLRAPRVILFRGDTWVRTERPVLAGDARDDA